MDENETKHMIDLRDIEKKKYMEIFFKYVLPTGAGIAILFKLLEILQG